MEEMTEPAGRPTPAPWREVFRGRRGRLTTGLLILEAMVGVEALVLTTILPAVERDLGGLRYYGWAFSAFGLATLMTIPLGGKATDRFGPRTVLQVALWFYAIGLVIAAAAPNMPVLVAGRFVQGSGSGALYVVSMSTVAKGYPESIRPRVFAVLASMWILPGVVGPPLGALLASTVGWRWAFIVPIPILALCVALIVPPLSEIPVSPEASVDLPLRWPFQLMIGVGLLLAGLTDPNRLTSVLIPIGIVIAIPALLHIAPPGTFTARPGLPATAATAFLTSAAFGAIDGFVPLMLTRVRGLSVGRAGLVVTAATITWSFGTWWQSRRFAEIGARKLAAIGGSLVGLAGVLVSLGLVSGLSVVIPYIGWALGGLGMGIVFPTIPLAAMSVTTQGREAGELSATLLTDYLGIAIGAGLGGASVALADSGILSLRAGIAGAFAVGVVTSIVLVLVTRRLPEGRER
jgi:MFS family permease